LDEAEITRYISTALSGVDVVVASREGGAPEIAWGDSFFIYDPDRNLDDVHRFPFATIVTKDYGDFDNASNLDRPGIFRLNIGVSKETYARLFGDGSEYDFTAPDMLIPHPVYGRNHWVSVLNPSESTFDSIKPLLHEAHAIAMKRVKKEKRPPTVMLS
jgi:hypothetical protein